MRNILRIANMENIEVKVAEIRAVFECLEELNDFLHQPENYRTPEQVARFLENGAYQKLHHIYYDVVWQWLPPEVQQDYENR